VAKASTLSAQPLRGWARFRLGFAGSGDGRRRTVHPANYGWLNHQRIIYTGMCPEVLPFFMALW